MNIPLLKEIQARILAEPDAFRMDTWSCGTAHCIAGWALVLSDLKIANPNAEPWAHVLTDGRSPMNAAAEALGLSTENDGDGDWFDDGNSEAKRLFLNDDWPRAFCNSYDEAESRRERAKIAAERIDHFIATNGAE